MRPGYGHALVLRPGEHLSRRAVSCPSGEYGLVHQHDGNVVLYRNADSVAVWATGTNYQRAVRDSPLVSDPDPAFGRPGRLALEEDGDLVVYAHTGERLWAIGPQCEPVESLVVHDWGKIALKNEQGHVLWESPRAPKRWDGWNSPADGHRVRRGQTLRNASLTSANGEYQFVVGEEDACFLCRVDGPVLWHEPIRRGDGFALTADGEPRTVRPDGYALPGIVGPAPDVRAEALLVTDDGLLALVDAHDEILWAHRPKPLAPAVPAKRARPARPTRPANVPELPATEEVPVVRTDFSDDAAWAATAARTTADYFEGEPDDEPWSANVVLVDDRRYAGLSAAQLTALVPADADWPLLVVADAHTMTAPEHDVLVVSLDEDSFGETRRATTGALVEMEINLSLANMDWEDFADEEDFGLIEPMNVENHPHPPTS
ncbi:DUF6924 domain-containing protein [Saccharopolyspora gregorii]|uniref:DUF6924 domain-containing protein n=1 Tax=Saccharopolyspora gregorii TaxID=33914 RepID=UPI0021ACDA95|nr:hypothetical protein [Saccharopolyspora gregorii]